MFVPACDERKQEMERRAQDCNYGFRAARVVPMESRYVSTVIVKDPDTHMECELEIRKLEDGTLVGLDAAYLSDSGEEEHPVSPYCGTVFKVPANEREDEVP